MESTNIIIGLEGCSSILSGISSYVLYPLFILVDCKSLQCVTITIGTFNPSMKHGSLCVAFCSPNPVEGCMFHDLTDILSSRPPS